MGEVLTVLPFQNTLATFEFKGSDVIAALENGLSQIEEGAGRFPQVAGMRYSFDKDAEPGADRLRRGRGRRRQLCAIDPEAVYSVWCPTTTCVAAVTAMLDLPHYRHERL
jgi:5'-nucleotidase/UDP-sugar diphosphatase